MPRADGSLADAAAAHGAYSINDAADVLLQIASVAQMATAVSGGKSAW
jgi:hypothetical protein